MNPESVSILRHLEKWETKEPSFEYLNSLVSTKPNRIVPKHLSPRIKKDHTSIREPEHPLAAFRALVKNKIQQVLSDSLTDPWTRIDFQWQTHPEVDHLSVISQVTDELRENGWIVHVTNYPRNSEYNIWCVHPLHEMNDSQLQNLQIYKNRSTIRF